MGDLRPAVLIVEDDKDFAENLRDILEDAGYEISLCGTIAGAREFLSSGCPDVILMDLNLPDGDGAGFLSEIRRLLPQSEVVVITGHASLHSATAAINTNAFGYLVKPVDLDQLRMMIRRAVEGKRAAAALRESEAKYRRIVETSLEGIWVMNADETTGYVNDEMARMLGYTADEMVGRPVTDFVSPEVQLDHRARLEKRRAGQGERFERVYKHADGSDVYCMVSTAPIIGDDGEFHGSFAMITDITERKQAEKALRERSRMHQIILDCMPCVALLLRPKSREIVAMNEAAAEAGATLGKTCFGSWPRSAEPCSFCLASEVWATGEERHLEVEAVGVVWEAHWVPVAEDLYMHYAFDITKRKQAEEALMESNEWMRMLSRQLVSIQERERRNVGRELHDQIGGSLTALSIALKMNPVMAQGLAADLTARIREMSLDLRPPMLDDLGLVPALIWHFERYTAQTKVQVDFKHMVTEPRYSQEIETAAYRIAQEALTNVARHAGVQEVAVRIISDEKALQIQVEDHGAGFDLDAVLSRCDTNGLRGMMERASLLGGELVVESSPGKGTSLTATLPLA